MSTITIDLNDLRALLNRVIPFAESGKYGLPVLESIHLQARGDYLIASATDRYVLGIARTKVEAPAEFDALVKLRDIKHILTTFKSRKGIITKVTLTREGSAPDGATLTVTLADGLFADADDLTAKYGLVDGEFPKLHELFTKWEAPTEPGATGYNPAYLARFAHVADNRNEPVKVTPGAMATTGGSKSFATIVQAGDYFLGAIMPVHLADDFASDVTSWTAMYAEPKPTTRRSAAKKTTAAKPRTRAKKTAA